jgi:hypothetical protein
MKILDELSSRLSDLGDGVVVTRRDDKVKWTTSEGMQVIAVGADNEITVTYEEALHVPYSVSCNLLQAEELVRRALMRDSY